MSFDALTFLTGALFGSDYHSSTSNSNNNSRRTSGTRTSTGTRSGGTTPPAETNTVYHLAENCGEINGVWYGDHLGGQKNKKTKSSTSTTSTTTGTRGGRSNPFVSSPTTMGGGRR